jgi:hypothetical protein
VKEQLQALSDAAGELLTMPDSAWSEGRSSAEWYRRASRRLKVMRRLSDALSDAEIVIGQAIADVSQDVDAARCAVLEDAASGDIL